MSTLPPHNIEAEQSVLGGILIDPDAMDVVAPVLRPADFYRKSHDLIYSAMLSLADGRSPIDVVTVAEALERNGDLDPAGGASYLSSLSNLTPTAVHCEQYARIVARKATMRRLIGAAGRIAAVGYGDPDDEEEAIAQAEAELLEATRAREVRSFAPLEALLHDAYDRVEYLFNNRGAITGIKTGLRDLDALTTGFQPGDLVILAARPSVGKTSLALNIAQHAAHREGKGVAVFSLEMSREQLVLRLLSGAANVDSHGLRTGFLEDMDFERLTPAMTAMSKARLYIDDTPNATPTEIRTKARRLAAEQGIDLIIVDYLQLMQGSGRKDGNRVQEVSDISRGLKALARELRVPVIALSQLSRQPEARESGEPRLSDLRESGAIEQDADVVMLLWRERDRIDEGADGEIINLKVAKHRNGPTGELQLWFRRSRTRFEPLAVGAVA